MKTRNLVSASSSNAMLLEQYSLDVTGVCILDLILITYNKDIAKLVIDPLANVNNTSLSSKLLQEQSSLQIALTLEAVWNLQNHVEHGGYKMNIVTTIKALEYRFNEYVTTLSMKLRKQCCGQGLHLRQ